MSSEIPTTQPCDLIIEAGWVVPIEPHGVVLEDHAVAIKDGGILTVMPRAEIAAQYVAQETVSRPQAVLLPGLVNAHVHNPMTLLRGVADDLPLMRWLTEHIWPIEAAVIGPEFVADGIELAIAEMLRGGTTCCNENYFFPDVAAATYRKHGFRALVGLPIIDFPTAWAKSQDEYFDRAGEVHDLYRRDDMVRTCYAPHAPYTVSDASFERIRLLSDQLDVPVHCHLHETAQEVVDAVRVHGMRQIARLDLLGLINDRLIAVHMTQLTDVEIALCAERGVSVVHCPESNLKLASGFCEVEKLRRAGVNLALGTDGCASNNDLDMFGELRTAALLAKGVAQDASALDAASALHMATLGGARALGFGDLVGSIEPGKRADLICVDMNRVETQPLYQAISQLVYATGRQQVSDVWISGQAKLRDGKLTGMDTEVLCANAKEWRTRIAAIGVKA
jgi:5-methylthioadenosine/S-adenosylhomocysteine deaminase